jgi:hypothetical protein
MANLRFLVLNATTSFNGTTAVTNAYQPSGENPKAPRSVVTQASIGRLSFKDQMRPGSVAALVRVRTWGISGLVAAVKSLNTAEVAELTSPDDPEPIGLNATLKTVTATSDWSDALLLGPSDALTLSGATGTVELMIIDLNGSEMVTYLSAIAASGGASSCCTSTSITVAATSQIAAWSDTLFVYVTAAAGSTITLPALSGLTLGAKAVFVRDGDGVVLVIVDGADELNGVVGAGFELDGRRAVFVDRRETMWTSTQPNVSAGQSISNAVAGATVAVDTADEPVFTVRFDFDAHGFLRLPLLTNAALGQDIILARFGGEFQAVVIPQVGQLLNGDVDGRVYLGWNENAVARKTLAGWLVMGDGAGRPARTLTMAADGTLALWGAGQINVLATQAGAQTITLPLSTDPIAPGARVNFGCAGAGGLTINGNGANIRSGTGAPAATMALVQHENAWLVWTGTLWIAGLAT